MIFPFSMDSLGYPLGESVLFEHYLVGESQTRAEHEDLEVGPKFEPALFAFDHLGRASR